MNGLILGFSLPFIGTAAGAACVFLLKNELPTQAQKLMLGFASGVMVAASVWSLLIPGIDMSEYLGKWAVMPAVVGFLFGMAFLWTLDKVVPHLHLDSQIPEGLHSKLSRTKMLTLAVTLHNLPEGMAVGAVMASVTNGGGTAMASAIALAIGIAIQNGPEGAIISMPLHTEGNGKMRSFAIGALSGLVEPVGAIATFLLTAYILPVLPFLLAFAAGAMLYVVVEELIPEGSQGAHSNLATVGFAVGFVLMMALDVMLG